MWTVTCGAFTGSGDGTSMETSSSSSSLSVAYALKRAIASTESRWRTSSQSRVVAAEVEDKRRRWARRTKATGHRASPPPLPRSLRSSTLSSPILCSAPPSTSYFLARRQGIAGNINDVTNNALSPAPGDSTDLMLPPSQSRSDSSMSATTTSAKETPATTGLGARSKPPAWALVDFRDDEPDVPAPKAPTPATPTPPSKRPSMSKPQDFIFSKELGSGSWSTVRILISRRRDGAEICAGFGGDSYGNERAIRSEDPQQGPVD